MDITCRSIDDISPNGNEIHCKIFLNEDQTETLFYKIWEDYGDEYMKKWMNAEGYEFKKKAV